MVVRAQQVADFVRHDEAVKLWFARMRTGKQVNVTDMGQAVHARDLAAGETNHDLARHCWNRVVKVP